MREEGLDCFLLLRPELEGGRRELQRPSDGALVVHLELAAGIPDEPGGRLEQAAREDELVVQRLVVGGDDARDVPGRLASPLTVIELGVVRRRRVLQRGVERRGQFRARDPHGPIKRHMDDRRGVRLGPGRPCGSSPIDSRPDSGLSERGGKFGDLLGSQPLQGREIGPLVLERLQRREIEEHGRAVGLARLAVERGRDQVAGTVPEQQVLGREEPVVAAQVHPAADRDGLPDQRGPELSCRRSGDGVGEEQPYVRTDARARHLQRRRCTHGPGGLQIGERVEHGRLPVEVSREPARQIAGEHGIEADADVPGQVRGQYGGRQREVPNR